MADARKMSDLTIKGRLIVKVKYPGGNVITNGGTGTRMVDSWTRAQEEEEQKKEAAKQSKRSSVPGYVPE